MHHIYYTNNTITQREFHPSGHIQIMSESDCNSSDDSSDCGARKVSKKVVTTREKKHNFTEPTNIPLKKKRDAYDEASDPTYSIYWGDDLIEIDNSNLEKIHELQDGCCVEICSIVWKDTDGTMKIVYNENNDNEELSSNIMKIFMEGNSAAKYAFLFKTNGLRNPVYIFDQIWDDIAMTSDSIMDFTISQVLQVDDVAIQTVFLDCD